MSNQSYLSDIREQLREAFEQLEQYKLSNELESQKRVIVEQQCLMLKDENKELRAELDTLRKELNKLAKKYEKVKETKNCDKCKENRDCKEKAEKEREVFMKERSVLKSEINELKKMVEQEPNEKMELHQPGTIDQLRRELSYKDRTIEDQKMIIMFLDDRLSRFEIEKLSTLSYV
jgi:chromosome segregation ATPase